MTTTPPPALRSSNYNRWTIAAPASLFVVTIGITCHRKAGNSGWVPRSMTRWSAWSPSEDLLRDTAMTAGHLK